MTDGFLLISESDVRPAIKVRLLKPQHNRRLSDIEHVTSLNFSQSSMLQSPFHQAPRLALQPLPVPLFSTVQLYPAQPAPAAH